jgi:hypothetical protein
VLEAVVHRMPHPRGRPDGPPRAMIIDSWFDNYVGVVMLARVVDGVLRKGDRIRLMATNAVYPLEQIGVFTPKSVPREELRAGEVGFLIAGIKELQARSATRSRSRRSCPTPPGRRASRCRASRRSSRRSSRACTPPRPANTTRCETRWRSSSSTTPACATSPR